MAVSKRSCTMKLTGLPENATPQLLERFVWKNSAESGFVKPIRVLNGYALLNYSSDSRLESACSKLDGKSFRGSVIRAKAKGSSSQLTTYFTVKMNHLPQNLNEEEIKQICSRFGNMTSIKLNEGYGYVNFSDKQSAQNAAEFLDRKCFRGQHIRAKMQPEEPIAVQHHFQPTPSNSTVSLFLASGNVSPSHLQLPVSASKPSTVKVELSGPGLSANELLYYFMKFGDVDGTPVIHSGSPDYAYVNFNNPDDAEKACKEPRVQLKTVKLTIKLSKKLKPSIPRINMQTFADNDGVVNRLLAKHFFSRIENKLTSFNVSVKPGIGFEGLQLTGTEEDIGRAQVLLQTELDVIKSKIVKKSGRFSCTIIPFCSNLEIFQNLQQKHFCEFSVMRNDGSEESFILFCATIAQFSKKPSPMPLALLDDYITDADGQSIPCWQFQDDSRNFTEMSSNDSKAVECIFQSFKTPSTHISSPHSSSLLTVAIGRFVYKFNFSQMTQENVLTRTTRSIKRCLQRTEGQQLPKEIVIQSRGLEECVANSLLELRETIQGMSSTKIVNVLNCEDEMFKLACDYCVHVQRLPGSGILSLAGETEYVRKMSFYLKEKLTAIHQPSSASLKSVGPYWQKQTNRIEVINVDLSSKEGKEIQKEFKQSLPYSTIIGIKRIQNTWLWEKYAFCKRRMLEKNGVSGVNEKRLFHGTSRKSPTEIYSSEFGFDFRFANSGKWGRGAYFASDASYSKNYSYDCSGLGEKIFLAYVLTGHSVVHPGDSSLTKPPLKSASKEQYDSVNGQSGTTQIFVVYDHEKSYPAYVIKYY